MIFTHCPLCHSTLRLYSNVDYRLDCPNCVTNFKVGNLIDRNNDYSILYYSNKIARVYLRIRPYLIIFSYELRITDIYIEKYTDLYAISDMRKHAKSIDQIINLDISDLDKCRRKIQTIITFS